MRRIIAFFKKETVLCIAAVCAILSMFAVPPDMTYLEYIDLRVLCLLFCLMAVILGMQDCGLFGLLCPETAAGAEKPAGAAADSGAASVFCLHAGDK